MATMDTTTASAMTAAAPVSTGSASSSNNNSILSSKVSRALELRSDTPSMKAALDALAHLHPSSLQGANNSTGRRKSSSTNRTDEQDGDHDDDLFAVDSRSVRVAIEHDALTQALLLQEELRKLLTTVRQLKQGVTETAALARRVDEVVHSNVISVSTSQQQNQQEPLTAAAATSAVHLDTALTGASSTDAALEQEQQLASILSDCFNRRNVARQRVAAIHEFLERFDLSEEDSRLLDHYGFEDIDNGVSNYVNGNAFLAALERVRLIRKELSKTFGAMDGVMTSTGSKRMSDMSSSSAAGSSSMSSSSALRMMEHLAQKQERSYERLYHWLQKYLHVHNHEHGMSGDSSMQPPDEDRLDEALSHPFVRKSLSTLRNVPAFYSHLLELIAQSRRSEETRRFLLALTSGYGGMPPIEMRAHDSVVYVGDMLAFCFRAFNVEADVARGLLKFDPEPVEEGDEDKGDGEVEDQGQTGTLSSDENGDDGEFSAEQPISAVEMLEQSMGGIARPLKSRILQVISNLARRPDDDDAESDDEMNDLDEEGASARAHLSQLYEICGLLLFYASALDKALVKVQLTTSPTGSFTTTKSTTVSENNPLLVSIMDCLDEGTNAYGASLRVYGAMLDQLTEMTGDSEASLAHAMIVHTVDVRKASPGFVEDVKCPEKYQQTLSVDWSCEVLVEAALPSCKSLDDAVALKQSIAVARQGGLSELKGLALEDKIREQETTLIEQVVAKEANDVLDLCGLGPLIVAWDRFEAVRVEGMTMSSYPGLTPDEVETSMKEFYASLYSPPIPSFEGTIKDPTLRKLARTKIASTVCQKYQALYDALRQPGEYDDLSFLGHTPSQVGTLFQV